MTKTPLEENSAPSIAVYPCLTVTEADALRRSLLDATHLHTSYKSLPCIGLSHQYVDADEYKSRVPASNQEIARDFPKLFFQLSQTYRTLGHSVVYPNGLALPLICLSKPLPTKLRRQFLCLTTGDLTFSEPSGACVQWHAKPDKSDLIFFA